MQVYTDGACGDEVVGVGWCLVSDDEMLTGNRHILGSHTSMEAEYYALMEGIRQASKEQRDEIHLHVDCEPLVTKMRVPDGYNQDWYDRRRGCHRLLNKFEYWTLEWIGREQNRTANRMAYEALEEGRRL